MNRIGNGAWTFAKWCAMAAFVCMDFTHSFPQGSWAQTFDIGFNAGFIVWVVCAFVGALTASKDNSDAL